MILRVDDPDQAVRLAARIVTGYGARHRTLGIRVGVHTGTAVRRGEDWFGSAVNLASRVADLAGSGEVLLTDAPATLSARRSRSVSSGRGSSRTSPSRFASTRSPLDHDAARLPVDPVCHMAVDPLRAAARQTVGDVEYFICSPEYARAFASASDAPVRSGPRVLLSRRNCSALP